MSEDPFDKAARIARGELDDELPTYDELKQYIGRMPITMLPGLLCAVIVNCGTKGVYVDSDGLRRACRMFVLKAEDVNSSLREGDTGE